MNNVLENLGVQVGLFSMLGNLFYSPEQRVLKLLQKQRAIIAGAEGSLKLLNNYLQDNYHNNAVEGSMNALGLDFEKGPGKRALNFATLDLLYEARAQHIQAAVIESLSEFGKGEISAEDSADNLLESAIGKGFQQTDFYKLAKLMNGLTARMVSYEEAVAGNDHPWASDVQFEDGALLFDNAKLEALAEIMTSLMSAQGKSTDDQVKIYTSTVRRIDSESIRYWQAAATDRERKADEAFEKWECAELNLLKKLVKG